MKKAYYCEQALERIARDVIIAYDPRLYYGSPAAIPIEDIIEAQGLVLEYQYLRNNPSSQDAGGSNCKTENRASKARKPLRHKTLLLHLFCQHPTSKNPVVSMTTGFFFCLFGVVFPLVFPYESEKNSFFTTRHAFNEVIHAF